MKITPPGSTTEQSTRRAIIQMLKERGSMAAKSIAEQFGTTTMAVRMHLYALEKQKLIFSNEEPRPLGRPTKMWGLTSEADRFFHNGHADLAVNLIRSMGKTFGSQGMERLLATRAKEQVDDYRSEISEKDDLGDRVKALAEIRTAEGYMAEVEEQADKSLLLVENHCPICEAASSCLGMCEMELDVFKKSLGPNVEVERTEHIQAGARRCAYRIARRSTQT